MDWVNDNTAGIDVMDRDVAIAGIIDDSLVSGTAVSAGTFAPEAIENTDITFKIINHTDSFNCTKSTSCNLLFTRSCGDEKYLHLINQYQDPNQNQLILFKRNEIDNAINYYYSVDLDLGIFQSVPTWSGDINIQGIICDQNNIIVHLNSNSIIHFVYTPKNTTDEFIDTDSELKGNFIVNADHSKDNATWGDNLSNLHSAIAHSTAFFVGNSETYMQYDQDINHHQANVISFDKQESLINPRFIALQSQLLVYANDEEGQPFLSLLNKSIDQENNFTSSGSKTIKYEEAKKIVLNDTLKKENQDVRILANHSNVIWWKYATDTEKVLSWRSDMIVENDEIQDISRPQPIVGLDGFEIIANIGQFVLYQKTQAEDENEFAIVGIYDLKNQMDISLVPDDKTSQNVLDEKQFPAIQKKYLDKEKYLYLEQIDQKYYISYVQGKDENFTLERRLFADLSGK